MTSAACTLLGVSLVIFTAAHLLPGGYAAIVLGPESTPAERQAASASFGLTGSLPVQYWHWLTAALSGNLGTSMVSHQSVISGIASRCGVTIELALLAAMISIVCGIPLGVFTALRSDKAISSTFGRLLSSLGVSLPDFVLGSVVVYVFSRYSLGLTVGGYTSLAQNIGANLRCMLLPALVLGVFGISALARTTRDSVLTVLAEPHVTASVARGEVPSYIIWHHILRNAAVPVVIVASTITAALLGGVVIVEYVFDLPGLGMYLVQAIQYRDYPVVEASVLIAAAVFVLVNMTVDIVIAVIDPRMGVRAVGS